MVKASLFWSRLPTPRLGPIALRGERFSHKTQFSCPVRLTGPARRCTPVHDQRDWWGQRDGVRLSWALKGLGHF